MKCSKYPFFHGIASVAACGSLWIALGLKVVLPQLSGSLLWVTFVSLSKRAHSCFAFLVLSLEDEYRQLPSSGFWTLPVLVAILAPACSYPTSATNILGACMLALSPRCQDKVCFSIHCGRSLWLLIGSTCTHVRFNISLSLVCVNACTLAQSLTVVSTRKSRWIRCLQSKS